MSHRGGGHTQRKRKNVKTEDKKNEEDLSPVSKVFLSFQSELDARYDKYERLIKKSRDLTIESKRIIFLLHRVSNNQNNDEVLEQAKSRLKDLFNNVIQEIALELSKREVYQFIRAFSPGLQEYVEALSFYYYLKNGLLISIEEVYYQDFLNDISKSEDSSKKNIKMSSEDLSKEDIKMTSEDSSKEDMKMTSEVSLAEMLSPTDYILGIADLTGELMRKCINSVGNGDIEEPFKLCFVLQNIHEAFLTYSNYSRELKRKLLTLQASLRKVENACYAIQIRGSEIPKHMLADFFSCDDDQEAANCED